MYNRNIFAELPVEDPIESDNFDKIISSPSKRRRFHKKPYKIQESENIRTLDSARISEFSKLSISKMVNEQGETEVKETKIANRKKVTGADNWRVFLENVNTTNIKNRDKDDFILNVDVEGEETQKRISHCVAIDCEMVGIGDDGKGNMLARVSIVNSLGKCLYDTFVIPTTAVTDYRTPVSGVRPSDLANGQKFSTVQKKVLEILRGKILVGHAVHNDLIVLKIRHPRYDIRDTSKFKKFYSIGSGTPSLKRLTSHFLNVDIQNGEHNSIQDAQATMQLYMLYRKEWEAEVKRRKHMYYQQHSHAKKKPKTSYKPKRFGKNYKK